MRKLAPLSLAFIFVGALAVDATGAPVAPGVAPAPAPNPIQIRPAPTTPVIASAALASSQTNPYIGDQIAFQAVIANPTSASLATNLVVDRIEGNTFVPLAKVPVAANAGANATVVFTDTKGLASGCTVSRYRLTLETKTSTRTMKITPTCSGFKLTTVDGGQSTPATRAGKLSFVSQVATTSSVSCGSQLGMKTVLKNDTDQPLSVYLRLGTKHDPFATGGAFTAPPHGDVTGIVQGTFDGHLGDYKLTLAPSSMPIETHDWRINIAGGCQVGVQLE